MNFLKKIFQAFYIVYFTKQTRLSMKMCFVAHLLLVIFCIYYTFTYPYAWNLKDTEQNIGIFKGGEVFGKGGGSYRCKFDTEKGTKILIVPYNYDIKLILGAKYKIWSKKYKLRPFGEKYRSYQIQSTKTGKYIQSFEYSSFSVLVMGIFFTITIFISYIVAILIETDDKTFNLKDKTWR